MTATILCSFPHLQGLVFDYGKRAATVACVNVCLLILFILSSSFLAAATYNSFVYFGV